MLIYILLRLFTHKRKFIEGDELRHMASAKNFYKLWNRSFYDTHPPLYSYLIKLFSFLGYYRAGVTVSLLCSLLLYLVCEKLYGVLGLSPAQKTIALACLTFNYTLIYYSNKAFRYQLIVLLGTAMIYFALTLQHFLMGLCWGLLSLTCSFVGLRAFWIWLLNPYWISAFLFCCFYGWWLGKKLTVYCHHDYYPSGLDGKIEPMSPLAFRQLISPMYFPWTYKYYGHGELGWDFKNWYKKIGGMFGLYQTNHKKLNILLGILIVLMGYFTIRGMAIGYATSFQVVMLTLILLYPSLFKRFLPRNSIIAIPLICYFIGKGSWQMPPQWVYFGQIIGLLGFLCLNRIWIFTQPRIRAKVTSRCLNHLPKDGVLVEGLIAYPIAYGSHTRVVVIPHDPDVKEAISQTKLSIKEFDLHYAVFSELYKTEKHLGYPAIEYIKSFKLIKTIKEDGDIYYIYELY